MNENETKQVVEDEDFFKMDESDFEDTPTEEEQVQEETVENEQTTQGTTEKTDEQKLLELLKSKVRYNGEEVDISSIDDVVANYQKGLNYDNLKSKQEKSENAVMNYISDVAKRMNMTPEQYIEKVKSYEQEQEKAKNEKAISEMVKNGVPEEIAREVIETKAVRQALERERAELAEQKQTLEKEKLKDKEYQEFLEMYPDVEVDKIPEEVFKNAKNSNLVSAYAQYENKLLKEKIKQMEQNHKNASSSPVTATSNGSATGQETKDAFLEGFDSV